MTDEKLRELIDRSLEGVKVKSVSVQVQTGPKLTSEVTDTWVHYDTTTTRTITIEVEEGE